MTGKPVRSKMAALPFDRLRLLNAVLMKVKVPELRLTEVPVAVKDPILVLGCGKNVVVQVLIVPEIDDALLILNSHKSPSLYSCRHSFDVGEIPPHKSPLQ